MLRKDGFVLFWGGEFSQWHKHDMVINNVRYNCCEQFMMAMKAKFFGDMAVYNSIMQSPDPKEQKRLGRAVRGFEKAKWDAICRKIVFHGNYAKFQDPILRGLLMTTWNDIIVEASPFDTIWGIGLSEDDPRCLDVNQWKGTNWLGIALMQVRSAIKSGIVPTECKYGS